MKRNNPLVWTSLRRWTMSYMMIFVIIIPLLMFSLLSAFNELSVRTAEESNRIFSERLLQSIENELRLIDNLISNEIAADDTMMDFFKKTLQGERFYSSVMPSVKLKNLINAMPLIESIYLFRYYDNTVLTPTSITPLEQFNDKQVIVEALAQPSLNRPWMSVRKGFTEQEQGEFISLVRYTPLFTGTDGVIVVNVRAESINRLVQTITASVKGNRVSLLDSDGNTIFSESEKPGYLNTEAKSDYLGWTIQNGVANGNLLRIVTALSKYWIMVSVAFCLLGLVWVALVSRRNFKPVQSIVNRIEGYTARKGAELLRHDSRDELKFIDYALENLLEQADMAQKKHEENLFYRRRIFFQDWLEGEGSTKPNEWASQLEQLEVDSQFAQLVIGAVKINKYGGFVNAYSRNDQNLLKYVLSNVIKEIAEIKQLTIWAEWLKNEQLAVVHMLPSRTQSHEQAETVVWSVADELIRWVNRHLDFTVSVGISSAIEDASLAHEAYREAVQALAYLPSLGEEPIVGYWQIEAMEGVHSNNPLQAIRELAISFRTGEEGWEASLDKVFKDVRAGLYSREEISNLLGYMSFFLQKELADTASELKEVWMQSGIPSLEQAYGEWETINELEQSLRSILGRMAAEMAEIRSNRGSYRMVQDMKAYMEEHYQNPDLSLQHLSESFGLHVKTVSRLFKEEAGVNFIDYLSAIRVERAKDLLVSTDASIQDITSRIGYLHPNTFIRSFKKQTGQTPGDYRKQTRSSPE